MLKGLAVSGLPYPYIRTIKVDISAADLEFAGEWAVRNTPDLVIVAELANRGFHFITTSAWVDFI